MLQLFKIIIDLTIYYLSQIFMFGHEILQKLRVPWQLKLEESFRIFCFYSFILFI